MRYYDSINSQLVEDKEMVTVKPVCYNASSYSNVVNVSSVNNDNISPNEDDDDVVDINSEEKQNVKDIQNYHEYQENQQNDQPWASTQNVRIVDTDQLPDPLPITDTEGCPKCGNIQAHWWIVQTDSADEPSTQFFRCTTCNHTWRTTRSS